MEFLINNYQTILLVLGVVYPPLLFLLPPQIASKVDLGVKVLKIVVDALDKAKNSKGGFSTTPPTEQNKIFVQKPKS